MYLVIRFLLWGRILWLWGILLFLLASCGEQNLEPVSAPQRPENFPEPHYTHRQNPFSREGFELGRSLFFDPILSKNKDISCASCHDPKLAFSDGNKQFSIGHEGQLADRHSPALFNLAWNKSFMWDGGITHLEFVPFAPLTHPKEMAADVSVLLERLNEDPEYAMAFQELFATRPINDQQLFRALSMYMSDLVSASSKYDDYVLGRRSLSTQEESGLAIFRQKCASCHAEPLFTNYSFHNIGLDLISDDPGRFRISKDSLDFGAFKVPSLRNVAVTWPYMHDGRFSSLQEVLDHYDHGTLLSPSLSALLKNPLRPGIPLSSSEQEALLAFLQTLTDNNFLNRSDLIPQ